MELEAFPIGNFNYLEIGELYTKLIIDSKKTCIVCMIDEEPQKWHRYELKCGHHIHTRCFRHWINKKKQLNCPYCGNLEHSEKNMYCSECKIWGHQSHDRVKCPKMRDFLKNKV